MAGTGFTQGHMALPSTWQGGGKRSVVPGSSEGAIKLWEERQDVWDAEKVWLNLGAPLFQR